MKRYIEMKMTLWVLAISAGMSSVVLTPRHLNASDATQNSTHQKQKELSQAVWGNKPEKVEKLLEQEQVDPNFTMENELPLLLVAARQNYVDIVYAFLRNGAHVKGGRDSPLHEAVDQGNTEVVRLFLKFGVNPNIANAFGETPLHHAVRKNKIDVISLLLQKNANPDVLSKLNETPLQLAVKYDFNYTVGLLLKKGANPDGVAGQELKLLHYAARHGNLDIVKKLIRYGATIDAQMDNGETPLHQAARENHKEVALVLLQHYADTTVTNKDGDTPVNIAQKARRTDARYTEMERLLKTLPRIM